MIPQLKQGFTWTKENPDTGTARGSRIIPLTNNHTISGGRCKASASNGSACSAHALTPMEAYAVRALARRAGISFNHAMLAAQLAGIVRELRHV